MAGLPGPLKIILPIAGALTGGALLGPAIAGLAAGSTAVATGAGAATGAGIGAGTGAGIGAGTAVLPGLASALSGGAVPASLIGTPIGAGALTSGIPASLAATLTPSTAVSTSLGATISPSTLGATSAFPSLPALEQVASTFGAGSGVASSGAGSTNFVLPGLAAKTLGQGLSEVPLTPSFSLAPSSIGTQGFTFDAAVQSLAQQAGPGKILGLPADKFGKLTGSLIGGTAGAGLASLIPGSESGGGGAKLPPAGVVRVSPAGKLPSPPTKARVISASGDTGKLEELKRLLARV